MKPDVQKGSDFTKGALSYIFATFIVLWLIMGAINFLRNSGGWGLDDTDRDGWNRSGLTLHTDAKTGVQYLSDGKGGLVRRELK